MLLVMKDLLCVIDTFWRTSSDPFLVFSLSLVCFVLLYIVFIIIFFFILSLCHSSMNAEIISNDERELPYPKNSLTFDLIRKNIKRKD